ncbi:MAG: hypothetical protein ACJ71R_18430 [Nitrososphaeraceae archaeon]
MSTCESATVRTEWIQGAVISFTSVRVLNEDAFYGIKILITILASVTGFANTSGRKPKLHTNLVP